MPDIGLAPGGRGNGGTRWQPWYTVVAVFSFGWVILFAGRAVLSPLLGAIGAEWRLDEVQLGLISSIFYLAYTAVQIPAGLLGDRLGRKSLVVASFLLSGLALAFRGVAGNYGVFLLAGALTGLAQGLYYAPQFALSSARIPDARRGLGSAIIYGGTSVGGALGFIFGSLVTFRLGWGWRAPFLILAAASVVAGLAVTPAIREQPAAHPAAAGAGEGSARAGTGGPDAVRAARLPVSAAFTPQLCVVYAINFTSLYAFFMVLSWLPYYLQYERGFSGTAAGLVSSLVPWASIVGGLIWSTVSDRLGSRVVPLRYLLPAAGVAVAAVGFARSPLAIYACLALYGLLGKSAADPLIVSHTSELAPPERAATALGFLNFFGMAASVVAPYVTGVLTRGSGSMRSSFLLAGAILCAGWVIAAVVAHDARKVAVPAAVAQAAEGGVPAGAQGR